MSQTISEVWKLLSVQVNKCILLSIPLSVVHNNDSYKSVKEGPDLHNRSSYTAASTIAIAASQPLKNFSSYNHR